MARRTRKSPERLTIHDVARKARVSPATVSRVLNGGPVRESTRERVHGVIRKTGFVPDQRASSLKRTRAPKIGLVVADIENPTYARTVKNAFGILRQRGFGMILGHTNGQIDEEARFLEMAWRERAAGVLVCTPEGQDDATLQPLYAGLMRAGIPLVFFGKPGADLGIDSVGVDNAGAMALVARHLVAGGRTRPAFVSGADAFGVSDGRLRGARETFSAHGVSLPDARVVCLGAFDIANGEACGRRLLATRNPPDAVVCGNDLLAFGVLRAAEALGLRVPGDVAVTGFDDVPWASWVRPRLTTVREPSVEIISAACDLVQRGRASGEAQRITFPGELVVRESAP